jgi:hypothetical protein
MTDSTFSPSNEQRSRPGPIRMRAADGALQPSDLDLPAEFEWEAGGHGSYGTARDHGRFIRGWLATVSLTARGSSCRGADAWAATSPR